MGKRLNRNDFTQIDWRIWLIAVGALALVLRLAYFLVAGKNALAWGDEIVYDQLARNLLKYGCFCFEAGQPSVWRAPLYAYMLAAIYSINAAFWPVVLAQALAGAVSAPLLAVIGLRVSKSKFVGVLAGLLLAINPILIFTGNLLYTETFYILLLLLFVYVCIRIQEKPANWIGLSALAGLLLGISLLLRPTLLLFPLCIALWAYVTFGKLSRAFAVTALITGVMLLAILPWGVRNYTVTGSLIPISANSGLNLHQGNYDNADGAALRFELVDPLPGLTEKARDDVYMRWGMQWIRENPGAFVRLIPLKLYKFFSFVETSNRGQMFSQLSPLLNVLTFMYYAAVFAGFVLSTRMWRTWLLIYLLILYPAMTAVVFYGGTRYGLVTQPFMFLLIALFLQFAYSKIRLSRQQRYRLVA